MQHTISLLLIEDDLVDQLAFKRKFKGYTEYTFEIASSVAEANRKVTEKKFDVIITDYLLGDGDAFDVIGQIKDTPIIFTTGAGDEAIAVKAVKAGAKDFLIKDTDGNYLEILPLTIERLVNREESERRLQSAEEEVQKLSLVASKITNAVIIFNQEGRIEWVNEAFEKIAGYASQEVLGTMGEMLKAHEYRDTEGHTPVLGVRKVLQSKRPLSFENKSYRKDGSSFWSFTSYTPVLDEDGQVEKIIAVDTDINERKKIEEALKDSEEKYRQIIEEASDIIYQTNAEGRFQYANSIASRTMGFSIDELMNMHYVELVQDDWKDRVKKFYIQQLTKKDPISYLEFPANTKDNEMIWIGQKVRMVQKDGAISGFHAVARDITERKKMEEELIHAKEMAESSRKAKEDFLANMSHEIRTPMNGVMGMTELLLKTEMSEKQQEYMKAIKISSENLLVIINDILDFSKIEAKKIEFESIDFNLEDILNSLLYTVKMKADDKGLDLILDIGSSVPAMLVGDPTRLNQIILNLVTNAIKFTSDGSVTIKVSLTEEKDGQLNLKFEVIDTGIGIAEDKQAAVFESFTQASSDTTRKYGGTGLGLAITKRLIELQGGLLSLKSKEGEGSNFYFEIAYKKSEKTQEGEQHGQGKDEDFLQKLEGVKALVVEDNPINQMLATNVLEQVKMDIAIANNGKEAIDMLQSGEYDIVLMDIQMPEMNGFEATKHIREKFDKPKTDIPIIAMTASALVSDNKKCIEVGMNGYVSKPFKQEVLYAKIYSFVKERKTINA